jgi:RNA polymerase sigma-70 factor (ECF subfamily)
MDAAALTLPALQGRAYDHRVRLDQASDEWLAGQAARGDTAAFEQLVLRHQDRLYTLALRVTLNDADARDCVQEGLISAWRAMPRFRADARFSTWMYRIVLRKAYDTLDRRKRHAVPTDEVPATTTDAPTADRLDVLAALASLEPDFRAVAVACDVIGLSMEEAAAVLELPPGTVKSRLSRARERLARELEAGRTP